MRLNFHTLQAKAGSSWGPPLSGAMLGEDEDLQFLPKCQHVRQRQSRPCTNSQAGAHSGAPLGLLGEAKWEQRAKRADLPKPVALAIRVGEEKRVRREGGQGNETTIILPEVWKLTARWDPGRKHCMEQETISPNTQLTFNLNEYIPAAPERADKSSCPKATSECLASSTSTFSRKTSQIVCTPPECSLCVCPAPVPTASISLFPGCALPPSNVGSRQWANACGP